MRSYSSDNKGWCNYSQHSFLLLFKHKKDAAVGLSARGREDRWCRRVHYCNLTHRSWFPLTRNKSFNIKPAEAKWRWRIIINDGKTIIANAGWNESVVYAEEKCDKSCLLLHDLQQLLAKASRVLRACESPPIISGLVLVVFNKHQSIILCTLICPCCAGLCTNWSREAENRLRFFHKKLMCSAPDLFIWLQIAETFDHQFERNVILMSIFLIRCCTLYMNWSAGERWRKSFRAKHISVLRQTVFELIKHFGVNCKQYL